MASKYPTEGARRAARAAQKAAYGRRREAEARAQGFSGYGQKRGARARARERGLPVPNTYRQAVDQRTLPTYVVREELAGRRPRRRKPQRIETAAGVVTTTTQLRVVRQATRDAQAAGHLWTCRVTFRDELGVESQRFITGRRRLGKGPKEPSYHRYRKRKGGRPRGPDVEPDYDQAPIGPVVARTVSRSSQEGGDAGLEPSYVIGLWDEWPADEWGPWAWLVFLWEYES